MKQSNRARHAPVNERPCGVPGGFNGSCEELARLQSEFCSLFSHPTRMRILWALAEGERSAGELAEAASVSLSNASQHLRLMRDKGGIVSRRDGTRIIYNIAHRNFVEGALLIRQGIVEVIRERAGRVGGEPTLPVSKRVVPVAATAAKKGRK